MIGDLLRGCFFRAMAATSPARHDAEIDKMLEFTRETSHTVRILAEITQAHGQRINNLEDRQ